MQTLPIYFHKAVEGLAKAGDVKPVSAAYAKNVLIPQKIGSVATAAVRAQAAARATKTQQMVQKTEKDMVRIREQLTQATVTVPGKAGEDGTLYAAIHPKDIAAAAQRLHIPLTSEMIRVPEQIKKIGAHSIIVRLGKEDIPFTIHIAAE